MSPEAQRIAIHKARGLSANRHTDYDVGSGGEISSCYDTPHYPQDLNAMHEAEKVLTGLSINRYTDVLVDITRQQGVIDSGYEWRITHATAAQRAEAFLRTIGKWTEG